MKNDSIVIAVLFIILIAAVVWIFYKPASKEPVKSSTDKFIDSLNRADMVDSIVKQTMRNAMFDTVGVYAAPVKVISAKLFKEEYSSYKSIKLVWKNISAKRISAIRFKWYGTNAFGEPADMGTSITEGFGGGYSDDALGPGKTDSGVWSILSRDGKKVVLAWPYEVVFEDGSKWKATR